MLRYDLLKNSADQGKEDFMLKSERMSTMEGAEFFTSCAHFAYKALSHLLQH